MIMLNENDVADGGGDGVMATPPAAAPLDVSHIHMSVCGLAFFR